MGYRAFTERVLGFSRTVTSRRQIAQRCREPLARGAWINRCISRRIQVSRERLPLLPRKAVSHQPRVVIGEKPFF